MSERDTDRYGAVRRQLAETPQKTVWQFYTEPGARPTSVWTGSPWGDSGPPWPCVLRIEDDDGAYLLWSQSDRPSAAWAPVRTAPDTLGPPQCDHRGPLYIAKPSLTEFFGAQVTVSAWPI